MENQRNAWKLPLVMGTARLLWLTWTNPVPCGQGSLGPRFYRCFSFQYQLHSWHLHFGIYTGDCVAGYLSDQLSRRLVFRGFLVLELDFPDGSDSKESVCSARDPGSILCWEHPLEKKTATHSSILFFFFFVDFLKNFILFLNFTKLY